MVKALVVVFLGITYGFTKADKPQPFVGDWNLTSPAESSICLKLHAGIRLDITYETINGTTAVASIISQNDTRLDEQGSKCTNGSTDLNETLALDFGSNKLFLYFTRDKRITTDDTQNRWQLFKVLFTFQYDEETFPGSKYLNTTDQQSNTNTTLSAIATSTDRSFSCVGTGAMEISDRFKLTFNNLRVQPFVTRDEFSQADHCGADQEKTDLIPIIIGAALAALVIIVLVAYLIGRARAQSPPYDNVK
jgi:lysosomal-associated membrane protein 1/2